MQPVRAVTRVAALVVGLALSGSPAFAAEHKAGPASTQLAVSGDVDHAGALTLDALRKLPSKTLPAFVVTSGKGDPLGSKRAYSGVLLRDVLAEAVLHEQNMHARNSLYFAATGTDGYRVVFSYNEIFNTAVGDSVLVALDRDGKPLEAQEGAIALVSAADLRTGPRHVKNLAKLEVLRAP